LRFHIHARHTATHCNALQHTATHCNTLQHTATHRNTLQHTATHRNTLLRFHIHARHELNTNSTHEQSSWPLHMYTYIYYIQACPTSSDIFKSSKQSLEAKICRSLLTRFSEKRRTSFGFELCFEFWKMSLQVG